VANSGDSSRLSDLLLEIGELRRVSGQSLRVATTEAEEAYAVAEGRDGEQAWRACWLALSALVGYGRTDAPLYRTWVDRLERHAAPGTVARVYAGVYRSNTLRADGRLRDALSSCRAALDLAGKLDDMRSFLRAAHQLLGMNAPPASSGEQLALARAISALPLEGLSPRGYAGPLDFGGLRLLEWGERDGAERLWAKTAPVGERPDAPGPRLTRYRNLILLCILDGRLEDAVTLMHQFLACSRDTGFIVTGLEFALEASRALLYLGRAEGALANLRVFAEAAEQPESGHPAAAALLAHAGRDHDARRVLADSLRRLDLVEATTPQLCLLLEAGVLLADRNAVAALVEPLRSVSRMLALQQAVVCIARLLGDASVVLGRHGEAIDFYVEALSVCERARFRPEMALARLGLADLLLRHFPSERATADEHLDLALAELTSMGMAHWLRRALRLREQTLASGAQARARPPDGLTDREAEVLRLIAAGRTNREISAALVLSVRTVARHITNIYAKIDARNKAEATAYAIRHGLVE
jgi:DNA-binding CsgD family transcriptional regulator